MIRFHRTLIAYSPFTLTPIFSAIIDRLVSMINNLPCQLVLKLAELQAGQVPPSTNNLHFLQAFFFANLNALYDLTDRNISSTP